MNWSRVIRKLSTEWTKLQMKGQKDSRPAGQHFWHLSRTQGVSYSHICTNDPTSVSLQLFFDVAVVALSFSFGIFKVKEKNPSITLFCSFFFTAKEITTGFYYLDSLKNNKQTNKHITTYFSLLVSDKTSSYQNMNGHCWKHWFLYKPQKCCPTLTTQKKRWWWWWWVWTSKYIFIPCALHHICNVTEKADLFSQVLPPAVHCCELRFCLIGWMKSSQYHFVITLLLLTIFSSQIA